MKENLELDEEGGGSVKEETGSSQLIGYSRFIVPIIAVAWCIFQLSIASWLIINSAYIRSIHLGFALLIAYFSLPALKRPAKNFFSFLSAEQQIPFIDIVLGILACVAALYYFINYNDLAMRSGAPLKKDIIIGITLIILLLEASRRVIGPTLTVITALFSIYVFSAEHMPEAFAFKGASLSKFIGKIVLSTEGIYGIPLDASATIVFLFVLLGAMLEKAGAGKFFIEIALSLLGKFKGGPAKAAIIGSGFTGLISGSSIANIVTTGTFTIPLMKKVGYPPTKAAAIEVAASTDGQIAPPIMGAAAFIIAEYLGVDYLDVVKAAIVPAFVSFATLFFIIHIEASKAGLKGLSSEELPNFINTLKSGLHYLLPVGVLIFELAYLRHSPEMSAFRAIIVMALIMVLRHPIRSYIMKMPLGPAFKEGGKDILNAMIASGRNMVTVAVACATAGIIVGVVTMGLGSIITELVDFISGGNIFTLVFITAIASLLIGIGLPTTATYIVMAALTAPVIVEIGLANGFFVPLMAAHLFCFYFGILADDTPPVGLAAYTAAAIANSPPIQTGIQGFMYDIRTAIIAFMFIFNYDLILYNIDSWAIAFLILFTACIGNFSFAAATQGWFASKNKWYEIPLFLSVTFVMMQPAVAAKWLDIGNKHLMYLVGILLFSLIYLNQLRRKSKDMQS